MNRTCSILVPAVSMVLMLLARTQPLHSEYLSTIYREGDWVSLTDFRFVNSLDMDHRILYIATSGGIERYNYVQHVWETPLTVSDGLPHREVLVVAYDPERGELWCGTRSGLAVYNIDLKSWRVLGKAGGFAGGEIQEIVIGAGEFSNYVYVKSSGSWGRFRKGIDHMERIPQGSVPEGDKVKKRGPIDAGLFGSDRYPFLNSRTDPDENLRSYPITAVVEDDWGMVWVGTWGGNLYSVSKLSHFWKRYRYGLASKSVTALAGDEDYIWFAGGDVFDLQHGGITRLSRKANEWKYYEKEYTPQLRGGVISDIEVAGDCLWIATSTGLARLDLKKETWKKFTRRNGLPDDSVLSLEKSGSVLWIGTRGGLAKLDVDSLSVTKISSVSSTAEVHELVGGGERIWIGTGRGLFSILEDGSIMLTHGPFGGSAVIGIRALSYWRGDLYLATDRGLYLLDVKEGTLLKDPFPGPVTGLALRSVVVDSFNVWVGTDTGVERYNMELGAWVSYHPGNFSLIEAPVTDIMIDGDYVWFASPGGVTRFHWNEPSRYR
ncbi:MAG: hypothetical protein ACE5OP_00255 [Candidatus Glassbacteria bacterium]